MVAGAKKLLKPRILVVFEVRNKLLRWPGAIKLRNIERAEVSRLSDELAKLPEAKVAVIITTYKRPELLVRAIRSVLDQTVTDFTLLVVDDGGGLPDLHDFTLDPRFFACSLSANTGFQAIARNAGIQLTRSKYVAFLDDDNTWEPEHLEVALAALEGHQPGTEPGYVYTAIARFLPDGSEYDTLSVEFDRRLLARTNFIDTNAMVIRRFRGLHWSRIRRPLGLFPREDWELAYRLSRKMRVQHVSTPTVRYLINPDSYYTDWQGAL
jgi:glycosyltransferase involved in cell wall biosynthesis